MISAVIFDFDGVIVDSERLHWTAFNKILEPFDKHISWDEYIGSYIGCDDRGTFRHAFPNLEKNELAELIRKKAAAFQELLEGDGAAALPGSVELIEKLSGNIPLAICTGALREDILPILGSLGISDAFDTIVTADDTHISKPDPAPYSKAWNNLTKIFQHLESVTTGLAIEDTPAGIASAKAASLRVLAVTNSYKKEFLTLADAVVDSLEGLDLEGLRKIF
jgi:HAD superfamily hydrolase (TIGR01509 family)